MEGIFFEISAIIIVSTVLALVAKFLRQPIILAFILSGIILGPLGLNWLHSHELIDVLSEFGVAFLLFLIGVELDLKKFKALNRVAIIVGIGQVLFTGAIGLLIPLAIGFSLVQSWFISIALTFSSTIIIVKLLAEKRQLESLYGRITIATLIIQDFLAAFALLLLEGFGAGELAAGIPWGAIILTLLKAVLIAVVAFALARYVFRRIFKFIGQSQELLFLWSIAWCLLFAALAVALDFSVAIAVFFAGMALASLEFNFEIAARIRTLRDFFIVIFFSFLGSQLVISMDPTLITSAIILSLFVLIGNPVIVYVILRVLRHEKRTAVFAGLAIAQISEFSFIIANLGLQLGHLSQEIVSMIAIIGIITMVTSTYYIKYNEKIYRILEPVIKRLPLGKHRGRDKDILPPELKDHIVLFGYHLTANSILEELKTMGKKIVVVDYNPNNADQIKKTEDVFYIYGDMREVDILDLANLETASLIISLVPYPEPNLSLIQYMQHFEIKGDVIVSASHLLDADLYYKAGATFVLHPESISLDYLQQVLHNKQLKRVSNKHKKEVARLISGLQGYL